MLQSMNTADLSELRKLEDYNEGFMETDTNIIYLGTQDNTRRNKAHLSSDQVLSHYKKSENFKGKVLFPESRGVTWTEEINQAFILGGIEAGKTFCLITPTNEFGGDYITQTAKELFWLEDNGYTFTKGPRNTLVCTPGNIRENAVINDYSAGSHTELVTRKNSILGIPPREAKSNGFTPQYANSRSQSQYFQQSKGSNTNTRNQRVSDDQPWRSKTNVVYQKQATGDRSWRSTGTSNRY